MKWKQEIIDELNDAIDNCDCGCTQALVDDIRSLHGQASYVYHTSGNTQWLYNEWFDEGDGHWHFQWTYKQDYDFAVAIGMGYGQQGMMGVGHTCRFHLEWWYWPWEGPMQFLSSDEELGLVANRLQRGGDFRTIWYLRQGIPSGLSGSVAARWRAAERLEYRGRRLLLSGQRLWPPGSLLPARTATMTFPACPSAFDSRTPTRRVVHRVCLADEKPTYRLAVTAQACRLCRQSPGTSLVKAVSSGDSDEAPSPLDQSAPAGEAPPPETPSLVRRTVSYAEALIEWTAAGRPERSDKDVEQIFHRFCKPCRWFDRRRKICRGCGCRVADTGFAITNKIKMATEHCPRNLW